ncbi:MAG TPA: hypothetical protein VF143_08150 [Candidatus Nanopelagicales bacterium]
MERRDFLVLGGALALGACTPATRPTPPPPSEPASDPDADLRAATAASELALIAAYRTAITAFPELGSQLRPLAAQHESHLAAIDPAAASGAASAAPGTSSPGSAALGPVASPASSGGTSTPSSEDRVAEGSAPAAGDGPPAWTAAQALTALAEEESAAQQQRATACDGVQEAALARVLCLVAASEGQHAVVLTAWSEREAGR